MRALVLECIKKIGEKVLLKGWVKTKRDHGKITFVDLRDRSGVIQIVGGENLRHLGPEFAVEIEGKVKKRPANMVNPHLPTGTIEIEVEKSVVLAKPAELPFDMGGKELNLQLPTLLDYRALTLRHPKVSNIFKVQEAVMAGFRESAQKSDCTEIFVPTVAASATEGGAEVFKVDYYGHNAFMTQSPQLYKQMLVPVFERVYTIAHAYRAEPSVTTRHLSESTQLDCEFGFVDFETLLDYLEFVGKETLQYVEKTCGEILKEFSVPKLKIVDKVPRLTMREAQMIIKKRTGVDHTKEKDLMPEDEREISRWASEEHNSDFVTVTHYPTKKRAFYTKADPQNPEYSLSYDLIFRGMEILSGSQRINDYQELIDEIKERGMDPDNFSMYLQAFKYGMPPEGGFSFGLERLTMQILKLENIREASLFPRDMERVDMRLSQKGSVISSTNNNVFIKLKQLLDSHKIKYQLFEHKPVFTSKEAAEVRQTKIEQGAKALVMIADKKPVMVVLSAANKIKTNVFKKKFKIKDLQMATPDEVKKITGIEIGAVPPFGNLFNIPVFVEQNLGQNKEIVFNAGLHTRSFKITYQDFIKLVKPTIDSFVN